ncbi:MAG: hypothetical protein GOV15_01880 [Candidatus Diapherotrites archaeon]|nr:hypothetical protein [Candidatus Diapherotrites archaeon]
MKWYFEELSNASRVVLTGSKYRSLFFLFSFFFFAFYIAYPVFTVPGNDLAFQLSITPWWVFIVFALLSGSVGLLLVMQMFVFKRDKSLSMSETGSGFAGLASGFIASLFAGASCAACLTAFLSFLSVGSIAFLLEYQWLIVGVSLVLVGISLFFSSKRVNNECDSCNVNHLLKE